MNSVAAPPWFHEAVSWGVGKQLETQMTMSGKNTLVIVLVPERAPACLCVCERQVGLGPQGAPSLPRTREWDSISSHLDSKIGHGWNVVKCNVGSSGKTAANADMKCLPQDSEGCLLPPPSLLAPSCLLHPSPNPAVAPFTLYLQEDHGSIPYSSSVVFSQIPFLP